MFISEWGLLNLKYEMDVGPKENAETLGVLASGDNKFNYLF